MPALSDYTAGTITLTNNSTAFTGSGTGWQAADFREGDVIFQVAGQTQWTAVVQSITSNTAGTLVRPWGGATGTYQYRMRYMADGARVTAQARNLIELLDNGNIQALAGLTGPGVPVFNGPHAMEIKPVTDFINGVTYDVQVDTLADRAAYDGQSEGFAVLVSDMGDGRSALFSKASNTSGDWSAPAYITGPVSTVPGVVWRGTYSAATLYSINDGVTFNGSSFRKLTTAAAGTAPSSAIPPVNTAAWEVLAAKGETGSISGVTPFWQGRITVDTTLAQARAGLTPAERGVFTPAGFATADLTPTATRTVIGDVQGFYKFAAVDGSNIQFPAAFPEAFGVIVGYMNSFNNYGYAWQEMTGAGGNRKWMRRATSATTWTPWAEIWHSSNLIRPTAPEITAGSSATSRIWAPADVVSAISQHAAAVPADVYKRSNILGTVSQAGGVPTGAIIERGSNANGDYTKFADGTMFCSVSLTAAVSVTTAVGSLFIGGIAPTSFPAAFIAIPDVARFSYRLTGDVSSFVAAAADNDTSATTVRVAVYSPTSGTARVGYIAKGRWF